MLLQGARCSRPCQPEECNRPRGCVSQEVPAQSTASPTDQAGGPRAPPATPLPAPMAIRVLSSMGAHPLRARNAASMRMVSPLLC
jgi:hypothetical protein